jgi:uncharacterized repeat protein (TIGR01451 family)
MKRIRRKNKSAKIGLLFIVILTIFMTMNVSYSLWYDELNINMNMETGIWEYGIKINKTLDYLSQSDNTYTLTINVWNNLSSDLTDVEVTDLLDVNTDPISGSETLTHG